MDTSWQGGRTAVPRDIGRPDGENPRSAGDGVKPRKVAWFEDRREWGLRKENEQGMSVGWRRRHDRRSLWCLLSADRDTGKGE